MFYQMIRFLYKLVRADNSSLEHRSLEVEGVGDQGKNYMYEIWMILLQLLCQPSLFLYAVKHP